MQICQDAKYQLSLRTKIVILKTCFPVPCGVRHLIPSAKAKIVGGKDADPGAYPWQAQISHKVHGHICGGTILTSKFIVSAAHCFPLKRGSNYTITLGKNYAMTPTPFWCQQVSFYQLGLYFAQC